MLAGVVEMLFALVGICYQKQALFMILEYHE